MMMRNKAEELAQLYPLLISFQIYEIQKRSIIGFNDTSDEEADLGEFANPRGRQKGGR